MRAGVIAQLLAIPFAAFLLGHFLPSARAIESSAPRILATLACFGLATPVFASAFAKPLDPVFTAPSMRDQALLSAEGEPCDYARLAALEPGQILTAFDAAPQILGKTDHTVFSASYHRNQQPMVETIEAYTGLDDQAALTLVKSAKVDYVIACSSAADIAMYRSASPDNFANILLRGQVPDWLQPVDGFGEGSLRVYRVR